jgi:hypothetical protein
LDIANHRVEYFNNGTCSGGTASTTLVASGATGSAFTGTNATTHSFRVVAIDTADNETVSLCSAAIVIDTDDPNDAGTLAWAEGTSTNLSPINPTWVASTSTDVADQVVNFFQSNVCGGGAVLTSASLASNVTTIVFAAGVSNNDYTYHITTTDNAGNSSVSACSASIFMDINAPVVTIDAVNVINLANVASYTVNGTCIAGDGNVTYLIRSPSGGINSTASVACSAAGAWTTTAIDVSSVTDDVLVEFDASQTDAASNTGNATQLTQLKDTASPSISALNPPASNTYLLNNHIDFIVTYSELVNVTGTRITLTIGSTTEYATYLSGSGSTSVTYRYTVKLNDSDADGIALASPLDLNGGTVADSAGNPLSPLTFTVPDTSGVLVNGDSPAVTSVTAPGDGTYPNSTNIDFTVKYAIAVDVVGFPRISIDAGGVTAYAIYDSGTGGTDLTFRYTVGPGEYDTDGITLSSPIDLNSGTIKSASAAPDALLDFTPPDTTGILVDGILYAGIDIPMSVMRSTAFDYAVVAGTTTECGTGSTINGDLITNGAFTDSGCTINGANVKPVPITVIPDLQAAYDEVLAEPCDTTITTLTGVTLGPGVHCFAAAATVSGNLILDGPADGVWLIKTGGAFTGTSLNVIMAGGGQACNVYWNITGAATATNSDMKGHIIASGALSASGSSIDGSLLGLAAMSMLNASDATTCPY